MTASSSPSPISSPRYSSSARVDSVPASIAAGKTYHRRRLLTASQAISPLAFAAFLTYPYHRLITQEVVMQPSDDQSLDNLLMLHGEIFPMDNGYWTKFEAYRVTPNAFIPH